MSAGSDAGTAPANPLRFRAFRFLVLGRTVTMFGNAVAPIALAFAVLDLTGSARDLGVVVGVRSLANVVFVLFGGVLADRLPRHLLLVGASLLAAGSQAAVAAIVLSGTATIPLLLVLSAVNGVASAVAFPAASALIPQTVPEEIRQQANAINRLAFNAAMILGAVAGGVLVAAVGPGWGLAVDAAAFALAAGSFALIKVSAQPSRAAADAVPRGLLADLRDGWAEFSSRTWLWVVVAGFGVTNMVFAASMGVLGPLVADDTIGRQGWGIVLGVEAAGMVVGGLLALKLRVRRLLCFGVACCFGDVLLVGALGVAPVLGLLLIAGFLAGFAMEQFGVAWETTMQEHIPAEKLGRVTSYDVLGSFVAIPLGQVAAGPLAAQYGARAVLIGAAAVCGLAVIGMLASRDVRTLPHRTDPARQEQPVGV